MKSSIQHKIVLFDGVCNLCNNSVVFIIKQDKEDRFRFAALQDEAGEKITNQYQIDTDKVDSIVLVDNEKAYTESDAALRIALYLNGLYPLLYGFMIVPRFLRNWVYDLIAGNRYKWFGKKDNCMIPTPELKSKFL